MGGNAKDPERKEALKSLKAKDMVKILGTGKEVKGPYTSKIKAADRINKFEDGFNKCM